jgi:hypothetical protein
MFLNEVYLGHSGAGFGVYPVTTPISDRASPAFERLPVNMTADEIRAMVLEVLG